MSKFKLELRKGKSKLYALKRTFLSTGRAIILTSLILVAGFLLLIFSDFKGIIEYGRDIGSETYIVVPPSPYVGNVNVENLSKNNLAFRRLVTELGVDLEKEYQDIPQVIDMKNIFSGTGPMFLDWGGHFTPKGNKVFAHSVANFVKSTDYN